MHVEKFKASGLKKLTEETVTNNTKPHETLILKAEGFCLKHHMVWDSKWNLKMML